MRWTREISKHVGALEDQPILVQPARCPGCTNPDGTRWLQAVRQREAEGFQHSNCRRLESLAAKLVKQLTYILYNMCDSTGSGATHLPATIASLSAHPQRILITLLVVQVIEIEWLVSRLQRWEQLPFAGVMMCSMPCVGVK